jgi:ubiquinone/menaquinone biosynthesis C-methylase UbiE
MNAFETWFCGSSLWHWTTRRSVLPWLLGQSQLGDHLLELGAGPGAATSELRRRVPRVTSLEYDHKFAAALHLRSGGHGISVLQADATTLPFPDRTFSSAIAVLVLHHLNSREQQDRALSEILRVLRPGGVFLALEIQNGWFQRVGHIRSTFVPIPPAGANARLIAAGFWRVTVDFRGTAFLLRALRAWDADPSPDPACVAR